MEIRFNSRIDVGRSTLRLFKIDGDAKINLLKVDNVAVREAQIAKLKRLRAERNEAETQAALTALTEGAKGTTNLLDLCVKAARAKATVGEMSEALEKVFTRHRAEIRAILGVYGILISPRRDRQCGNISQCPGSGRNGGPLTRSSRPQATNAGE